MFKAENVRIIAEWNLRETGRLRKIVIDNRTTNAMVSTGILAQSCQLSHTSNLLQVGNRTHTATEAAEWYGSRRTLVLVNIFKSYKWLQQLYTWLISHDRWMVANIIAEYG